VSVRREEQQHKKHQGEFITLTEHERKSGIINKVLNQKEQTHLKLGGHYYQAGAQISSHVV